ncbi:protein-L-isoaspartate O-methyltransferase [Burkholderiaceae bacterium FT117]|uniref:protein-L-isoaspartate O-methyltransferase family protein n=1 Tax=Zeimonas sediminis TaxID=2944268 RepID=UPI002342CCF8|nr:protein-L-isoaspartate O-methyltransferase [Zeimonas sediminis]MCM5572361.1 protein-L-isoaspartate O-methyltransferase [Zeimonas sediminis]
MDIERARFNMVEQQIRPWEVLDQDVLDLLFVVRREEYVPAAYRQLAFTDMQIPLTVDGQATGEVMLAPKVEARLLQSAAVRRHETVLEIGTGSGHMAALLAHRARRVVSCEIRPELARFAADNLARAGVANVTVEARNGLEAAAETLWDLIVLSGSVPFVPDSILQQLNPGGGRLVAIVGELPMMVAQVVTRVGEREYAAENLFDTVATPLVGFPQKEKFRF